MQNRRPGTDARRADEHQVDRLIQWCFRRTERDARLAKQAGRPITQKNLHRLLLRRLWAVVEGMGSEEL